MRVKHAFIASCQSLKFIIFPHPSVQPFTIIHADIWSPGNVDLDYDSGTQPATQYKRLLTLMDDMTGFVGNEWILNQNARELATK